MFIMDESTQERLVTLLKATYNLLYKQNESPFVLNILEEVTHYDGLDCDGYCLLDDILGILSMIDIEPDETGRFEVN